MQVPKAYANYARQTIENSWTRLLDRGQAPLWSKKQLREMILANIETKKAADGDPATWIACQCGDGLYYRNPTPEETQRQDSKIDTHGLVAGGLCYRCEGKAWQSPADVARNRAYRAHKNERYDA